MISKIREFIAKFLKNLKFGSNFDFTNLRFLNLKQVANLLADGDDWITIQTQITVPDDVGKPETKMIFFWITETPII